MLIFTRLRGKECRAELDSNHMYKTRFINHQQSVRVLFLLCVAYVTVLVCVCLRVGLPLSVRHGLHEMRVKLVAVTWLFLLKMKKKVVLKHALILMGNTAILKKWGCYSCFLSQYEQTQHTSCCFNPRTSYGLNVHMHAVDLDRFQASLLNQPYRAQQSTGL